MWFKPTGRDVTASYRLCPKCTRMRYHLEDMLKKKQALTPKTKTNRTLPHSRYPVRYLTPSSCMKKERNVALYQLSQKRIVKQVKKYDVDVSEVTDQELISLVSDLEKTCKSTLDKIMAEADLNGKFIV